MMSLCGGEGWGAEDGMAPCDWLICSFFSLQGKLESFLRDTFAALICLEFV
jgi:hypothetical protein